jgi:protein ImuB
LSVNVGVSGVEDALSSLFDGLRLARRVAAVWMRSFSINISISYLPKLKESPLAIIQHEAGRSWITAADYAAQSLGIAPGQAVADARALYPDLATRETDPAGDRRALERLADWCGRYTPWVGIDACVGPGEAGLFLDLTGCAHLRGGETGLLADLERHFARFGLEARLALAESPGAAWAWARFRPAGAPPILAPGEAGPALRPLPIEALRIPAATAETLRRLGLRRIADLAALPRAALAARFGADLLRRLDQALGRAGNRHAGADAEPIAPRRPPACYAVRRDFAEPLMVPEALGAVLARLLPRLCRRLERDGLGARRLVFTLYRIDGTSAAAAIGTSRAARDPAYLAKLFAPKLESLDPDPGIETLVLEAPETAPFVADQNGLMAGPALAGSISRTEDTALSGLIDRLANRLGADRVGYLAPEALHLPERQSRFVSALATAAPDWSEWPATAAPLPLRLFPLPEPVEIETPGAAASEPPLSFLWRGRLHRITAGRGPDRRLGAWWQGEHAARDYWAIEDTAGRRLWLCRDLASGRWAVHGVLAPESEAAA